jgi:integrase
MSTSTSTSTRRTPKTGGFHSYETSGGTLWAWKATLTLPDGTKKVVHKRGYRTKTGAVKALNEAVNSSDKGTYAEPSKQPTGAYLATWLDGLQHAPSTIASYRKNVRLHITPYLGSVPLASLTPVMLTELYRKLEKSGRKDGQGEGLSARTVRYIHTIISAALREAVETDLLPKNPAAKAKQPTAKQAAAPEMQPWTAAQLGEFLAWARDNSELHAAWHVLAMTGMRRGELLALRWKDVDFAAGTITVQRSSTLVRIKGERGKVETGPTKSGKPRVVDLDPGTVAVLKAHKAGRGNLNLVLVQPDAHVFGDVNDNVRQPEHFSREWNRTVERCGQVPAIRLHDLRHYADGWVMCPAVAFPLLGAAELVLQSA